MALVVEDGTGAADGANSYADLTFIRAYNVARNRLYAIGNVNDAIATGQALLAMDYIEAQEPNMQGLRVFGLDQPLSFPRTDVYIMGELLPDDDIPIQLQNAQAELAWQINAGVVLFPTFSGQMTKRRKVGPIEREFFAPGSMPYLPAVDVWLLALLNGSGGSFLRVVRI